jgi:hypothetical protein
MLQCSNKYNLYLNYSWYFLFLFLLINQKKHPSICWILFDFSMLLIFQLILDINIYVSSVIFHCLLILFLLHFLIQLFNSCYRGYSYIGTSFK